MTIARQSFTPLSHDEIKSHIQATVEGYYTFDWVKKKKIAFLINVIFDEKNKFILQQCRDSMFLDILCKAERKGSLDSIFKRQLNEQELLSCIIKEFTEIAALQLLQSREIDIKEITDQLSRCKQELAFIEYFAFSYLQTHNISQSLIASCDYTQTDFTNVDLTLLGFTPHAEDPFIHVELLHHYCARYLAACFLVANNTKSDFRFAYEHRWTNITGVSDVAKFIQQNGMNEAWQAIWCHIEILLSNYMGIVKHFAQIKNYLAQSKLFFNELSASQYEFKLDKPNPMTLIVNNVKSNDPLRKRYAQLLKLMNQFNTWLSDNQLQDKVTITEDEDDFIFTIVSDSETIAKAEHFMKTFSKINANNTIEAQFNQLTLFATPSSMEKPEDAGESFECKCQ